MNTNELLTTPLVTNISDDTGTTESDGNIPCFPHTIPSISEKLYLDTPENLANLRPNWIIKNCGFARNHHSYLENVARINGMVVVENSGGGDCFFDAVRHGLLKYRIIRNVTELRLAASVELEIHAEHYRPLYTIEDNGQFEQARTYDQFIQRTRDGYEWATQMTISAMATALQLTIRIISTATDENQQPTANQIDIEPDVSRCGEFIVIGFDSVSAHYVGFQPERVNLNIPIPIHPEPSNVSTKMKSNPPQSIHASLMDNEMSETENMYETSNINTPMDFRSIPGSRVPSTSEPMSVTVDDVSTRFVFPPHDSDNDNVFFFLNDKQCRNCLRNDSPTYPLKLKYCRGKYTQRNVRLLKVTDKNEQFILCYDCQIYLEIDSYACVRNLWTNGWPCVIRCLLSCAKYSNIRVKIWESIPMSQRYSWRTAAVELGLDINSSCTFSDYTSDVERFQSYIKSGIIAQFISAMDDYAFPSVKCPAGCFAFLDQCSTMPFNHFIF